MATLEPNDGSDGTKGQVFSTTHWSLVLAAGHTSAPGAQEALENLCRTYWPPLYAYIRRQGRNHTDTCDLAQGFFHYFLEKKLVKRADPARGRFRCFLLASLKNYLTGEWRHEQSQKHGGGRQIVSLDEQQEAETHFAAEPADSEMTPDQAFEKSWARTFVQQVLARLRDGFATDQRQAHFDALVVFVWGDPGNVSREEVGARLGMTPNAFDVAVHRLRRRFGELLREEIAKTVADPVEIDDELRHLVKLLAS